jgi:hypothetical protein
MERLVFQRVDEGIVIELDGLWLRARPERRSRRLAPRPSTPRGNAVNS